MPAIAGAAWILSAVAIGYLGLLQLGYVGSILDNGTLQETAFWNLASAAITLYFGGRLLVRPTPGNLRASVFWAVLTVLWNGYQIAQGASHWTYIAATIGALAAGVLSGVAIGSLPAAAAPAEPVRPVPAPVIPPPTAAQDVAVVRPSQPTSSPVAIPTGETTATSHRNRVSRSEAAVVALIGIAVVGGAYLLVGGGLISVTSPTSGSGPAATLSAHVPVPGAIWFGVSYDRGSLEISHPLESGVVGHEIAVVAHLRHGVANGEASMTVSQNGSEILRLPAIVTTSAEVVAWTFTPPGEGLYLFEVYDQPGSKIAGGALPVRKGT